MDRVKNPAILSVTCHHQIPLEQRFSTFFISQYTEQGAKIVKAHQSFFKERFYHYKMSIQIVFKSAIAKILIIVLFLKIMLIQYFKRFSFKIMFIFVIILNTEMRYH
jgi:hypothetical protein